MKASRFSHGRWRQIQHDSSSDVVMYFLYERPDGSRFTSSIHPSNWGKEDVCSSLICSLLPDTPISELTEALSVDGDPDETRLRWSPLDITYLEMEFEVPLAFIGGPAHLFRTFPETTTDGEIVLMVHLAVEGRHVKHTAPPVGCVHASSRLDLK